MGFQCAVRLGTSLIAVGAGYNNGRSQFWVQRLTLLCSRPYSPPLSRVTRPLAGRPLQWTFQLGLCAVFLSSRSPGVRQDQSGLETSNRMSERSVYNWLLGLKVYLSDKLTLIRCLASLVELGLLKSGCFPLLPFMALEETVVAHCFASKQVACWVWFVCDAKRENHSMFAENILLVSRSVLQALAQRLPAMNRHRLSKMQDCLLASGPQHRNRLRWILLCAMLFGLGDSPVLPVNPLVATAIAQRPQSLTLTFQQRCQLPHGAVIERVPLRQAIDSVARPATPTSLNVWLDRSVNPDQLVTPGPLGPTRFASLQAIASAAGCLSVAAGDCLIIGRPDWVAAIVMEHHQTLAMRASRERRRIDIQWPQLTTPEQAVALLRRKAPWAKLSLRELPHDLWPAVNWQHVSPAMAWLLIEGQFLETAQIEGKAKVAFRKAYGGPFAVAAAQRSAEAVVDFPVTVSAGDVTVTGDIETHARFCALWLGAASQQAPPQPNPRNPADQGNQPGQQDQPSAGESMEDVVSPSNPGHGSEPTVAVMDPWKVLRADRRQFTLQVIDKPAGAVLLALLQNAGITAEIDPEANQAAQTLVNLQDRDQTLEQLVRQVLRTASLKLTVGAGKARVVPAD